MWYSELIWRLESLESHVQISWSTVPAMPSWSKAYTWNNSSKLQSPIDWKPACRPIPNQSGDCIPTAPNADFYKGNRSGGWKILWPVHHGRDWDPTWYPSNNDCTSTRIQADNLAIWHVHVHIIGHGTPINRCNYRDRRQNAELRRMSSLSQSLGIFQDFVRMDLIACASLVRNGSQASHQFIK